jgi:hypothetical protein
MKTDDNLGHIGPLLVAAGKTKTFWTTAAPAAQPAGHGTFDPTQPLAPADSSGAEIAAALDRRYGAGAGAQTGTGGAHGGRDITPLYIANGWDPPVARADQQDMTMVEGAVDWANAEVAKVEAGKGGGGDPLHVVNPAGSHPIIAQLARDLDQALANANTALGKAGVP